MLTVQQCVRSICLCVRGLLKTGAFLYFYAWLITVLRTAYGCNRTMNELRDDDIRSRFNFVWISQLLRQSPETKLVFEINTDKLYRTWLGDKKNNFLVKIYFFLKKLVKMAVGLVKSVARKDSFYRNKVNQCECRK